MALCAMSCRPRSDPGPSPWRIPRAATPAAGHCCQSAQTTCLDSKMEPGASGAYLPGVELARALNVATVHIRQRQAQAALHAKGDDPAAATDPLRNNA